MNRFGSHPNHENRRLQEGPPPQGLFRGTADRKFFWHFSHRSAAGPCFGAVAYIVTNGQSGTSHSLIIMSTCLCGKGKGKLIHQT
jgi:hypothetical protein